MAMTDIASLRDRAKLPVKQAGGSTVAEFFEANRGAGGDCVLHES